MCNFLGILGTCASSVTSVHLGPVLRKFSGYLSGSTIYRALPFWALVLAMYGR